MSFYTLHTKIIDAKWSPEVNYLIMKCGRCSAIFEHRADKCTVRCPSCGKQSGLDKLRGEYYYLSNM